MALIAIYVFHRFVKYEYAAYKQIIVLSKCFVYSCIVVDTENYKC